MHKFRLIELKDRGNRMVVGIAFLREGGTYGFKRLSFSQLAQVIPVLPDRPSLCSSMIDDAFELAESTGQLPTLPADLYLYGFELMTLPRVREISESDKTEFQIFRDYVLEPLRLA